MLVAFVDFNAQSDGGRGTTYTTTNRIYPYGHSLVIGDELALLDSEGLFAWGVVTDIFDSFVDIAIDENTLVQIPYPPSVTGGTE